MVSVRIVSRDLGEITASYVVIEPSGVQFGLKGIHVISKSNEREFDLKSQVWFQTKLHDTKFNYQLIIIILKSLFFYNQEILTIKIKIPESW